MTVSIFVSNTKGGCGKTTIATNLASAFADAGLATAWTKSIGSRAVSAGSTTLERTGKTTGK